MVSNNQMDNSRREIYEVSNFRLTDKQLIQKCKFSDDNMLYDYFCAFQLKTQIICKGSNMLLQSMILSRNKI